MILCRIIDWVGMEPVTSLFYLPILISPDIVNVNIIIKKERLSMVRILSKFIFITNISFCFVWDIILRYYCFILYVFVFESPLLVRFMFFCRIPPFYAKIPALYAKIPCYLGIYIRYRARCVTGGRGSLGGLETSLASYMFLAGRVV